MASRLVYLDSAASSQKPRQVLEAMDTFTRTSYANIHRGAYTLSEEATAAYEGARKRVARFINARNVREVVWTRNTTESINLVANSWGGANLKPGDVILLSEMEHHSNIVPWQLIAARTGARSVYIPVTDEGELDLEASGTASGKRAPEAGRCDPDVQCAGYSPTSAATSSPKRMRPGRWCCWTAPRACPIYRWTCGSWTVISWRSAAIRCWDRAALACSGPAVSCWKQCRHSWVAVT